jgi:hypothetical protein
MIGTILATGLGFGLALLLLLIGKTLAQGYTWTPVITVSTNNPTEDDQGAAIAVDSMDNAHLIWTGRSGDMWGLYYRMVYTDLTASEVVTLAMHQGVFRMQVVVDRTGIRHVLWHGYLGDQTTQSHIYYQRVYTDVTVSDVMTVSGNTPSGAVSSPRMALDELNNGHMVWWAYPHQPGPGVYSDVYYRMIHANMTTDEVILVSTNNPATNDLDPVVAMDAMGNAHIAWSGYSVPPFAQSDIYYRVVYTDGTSGSIINISSTSGSDKKPGMVVDRWGNAHIVWQGQFGYSGSDDDIYYRVVYANLTTSAVMNISNDNPLLDSHPQVALDGQGNAHIVWQGYNAEIEYRVVYTDQTTSKVVTVANPQGCGTSIGHQSVVDGTGNSHVVWHGCDDGQYDVYYRTVYSDLNVSDAVILSTNNPMHNDLLCQVATDSRSDIHVVWQGDEDGQSDIYYRTMQPSYTCYLPIVMRNQEHPQQISYQ